MSNVTWAQCVRCDSDACECELVSLEDDYTEDDYTEDAYVEDTDYNDPYSNDASNDAYSDNYTDDLHADVACDCQHDALSELSSSACSCGNHDPFASNVYDASNALPDLLCRGAKPEWFFDAGSVYMTRATASSRVLLQDTTNPIRQVNAADFDFGWESGLDLSIKRVRWDEKAFEIRFLGLQEMEATTRVNTGGLVELRADPPIFAPDVTSIDARYTSDLYGFEANWHFVTYYPFNYIAGFRYLGLDEDLTTVLNSNNGPTLYRTLTRNDLYGVQVGVTSVPDMPLFDLCWLTWSAKVGLYGNDARQQSVFNGLVGQQANENADTTAFLGELGIGLRYPLTNRLTIAGGYSMLILERVAVASDQLQNLDFFNGTGSNDRGNLLYHGANISLTFYH